MHGLWICCQNNAKQTMSPLGCCSAFEHVTQVTKCRVSLHRSASWGKSLRAPGLYRMHLECYWWQLIPHALEYSHTTWRLNRHLPRVIVILHTIIQQSLLYFSLIKTSGLLYKHLEEQQSDFWDNHKHCPLSCKPVENFYFCQLVLHRLSHQYCNCLAESSRAPWEKMEATEIHDGSRAVFVASIKHSLTGCLFSRCSSISCVYIQLQPFVLLSTCSAGSVCM